jgi:hypothetical protein
MSRYHAIVQPCLADLLATLAPLPGYAGDYPSRPII